MIFIIETDDEIAGLDIESALMRAGIKHTLTGKQKSQPTSIAAGECRADHAKFQAMRLAPKFCPACGVRLQTDNVNR